MKFIFFTFCIAIAMISSTVKAQDNPQSQVDVIPKDTAKFYDPNQYPGRFYNTWSVSVNVGSLIYYGDLSTYDWVPKKSEYIKLGYGFAVSKSFTPTFALKGSLLFGSLKSGDSIHYFENTFYQPTLTGVFNLSNMFSPNQVNRKVALIGNFGLGLFAYNSLLKDINTNAILYSKGYTDNGKTKSSSIYEVVVPVGIGVKVKVSKSIDVALETTINLVNSDWIDAYSIKNSSKDKYNYTSLSFTYNFGKKDKSLAWITPREQLFYDGDNDGVPDIMDKQLNTIKDAPIDGSGVAMDTDHDGVPDIDDAEPLSPKNAKVNSMGVAYDKDKDGVPDALDKEPNTPKGALVNFQGISIGAANTADDDGDGVPNVIDLEPNTPKGAQVNAQGISLSNLSSNSSSCATSDSVLSVILPSVYFDLGSTKVDDANLERIAPIAKLLMLRKNINIEVIGYADKTGQSPANRELSKKRAEAVLDVLHKKYGIEKERLFINFFGDTKLLVSDSKSPINRRVDFMIVKP